MSRDYVLLIAFGIIVCAISGALIHGIVGLIFGTLLGPLGILIAAVLRVDATVDRMREALEAKLSPATAREATCRVCGGHALPFTDRCAEHRTPQAVTL